MAAPFNFVQAEYYLAWPRVSMPAPAVDLSVLDRLRKGDERAFEKVFVQFYRPLCGYAYQFLSDRDEAEEVVQATLISFWEKREVIDIESSFKAYLYRMVRNACLNVIKHEKVKEQHAAYALQTRDAAHNPTAQTIGAQELETRIGQALRTLPEQCRLVFHLSRFEELKYQEIATQLNISIKTVENHMGKALKLMREQLKDYLPLLLVALLNHLQKW